MGTSVAIRKEDVDVLFASILDSRHLERDRCMFMFGLKSGLRVGEIALLTWDMLLDKDNNIKQRYYTLPARITKGEKCRKIFFNPILCHAIYQHFLVNFTYRKDRVFIADRGKPFTENNLAKWMYMRLQRAGLNYSSHSLRKRFSTDVYPKVLQNGGTINDLGRGLGHSHPSVTCRYLARNDEALEAAVMSL